jgi:hypothetical protein
VFGPKGLPASQAAIARSEKLQSRENTFRERPSASRTDRTLSDEAVAASLGDSWRDEILERAGRRLPDRDVADREPDATRRSFAAALSLTEIILDFLPTQ